MDKLIKEMEDMTMDSLAPGEEAVGVMGSTLRGVDVGQDRVIRSHMSDRRTCIPVGMRTLTWPLSLADVAGDHGQDEGRDPERAAGGAGEREEDGRRAQVGGVRLWQAQPALRGRDHCVEVQGRDAQDRQAVSGLHGGGEQRSGCYWVVQLCDIQSRPLGMGGGISVAAVITACH